MADIDAIHVRTSIKFSEDILKLLSGLTYFYDSDWIPNFQESDSLPFAFVYVIKDTITKVSNVSTKRIILYEDNVAKVVNTSSLSKSVLEVVADNIVNEPAVHQIECLVPYGILTGMFSKISNTIETVLSLIAETTHTEKETSNNGWDRLRSAQASLNAGVGYVNELNSLVSKYSASSHATYNKDSLLAMQDNRSIIKYKTWEGAKSIYGAIKHIRIEKMGDEDDIMRATIEMQEMPVMVIGEAVVRDSAQKIKFMDYQRTAMKAIYTGIEKVIG